MHVTHLFIVVFLPSPPESELSGGRHFSCFGHGSLKQCLLYSRGSINVYCINKSRFLELPQTGHQVSTRLSVRDGRPSVSNQ